MPSAIAMRWPSTATAPSTSGSSTNHPARSVSRTGCRRRRAPSRGPAYLLAQARGAREQLDPAGDRAATAVEIPAAARLCAAAGSRRRLGMGEEARRRARSRRRRCRRRIGSQCLPTSVVQGAISGSVASATIAPATMAPDTSREPQPGSPDASASVQVGHHQAGDSQRWASTCTDIAATQTTKLALCRPSTTPRSGPIAASVTPVPKSPTVDTTTSGPSSRRRIGGGPLPRTRGGRCSSKEAVAGARDLQAHDRHQQHPDEDVPGQERLQREQRQPLDCEQHEQDGAVAPVRRELPSLPPVVQERRVPACAASRQWLVATVAGVCTPTLDHAHMRTP